jgi:hypothetical protein
VTSVLEGQGEKRQVRLTAKGLLSRVRKPREALGGAAVLKKVAELGPTLAPADKKRLVEEIERLGTVLEEISRALRRGR